MIQPHLLHPYFASHIVRNETNSYLKWSEFVVDQKCKTSNWYNKELSSKCVMVAIICGFELEIDQVDCSIGTNQIYHL